MESPAWAAAGAARVPEPGAPPIVTHWTRILYVDLFAPARRGSRGGADDSAEE
jgi:hypothetical protein